MGVCTRGHLHKFIDIYRQTETEAEAEMEKETERERDRQTDRDRHTETHRQADRQTEREREGARQTERQTRGEENPTFFPPRQQGLRKPGGDGAVDLGAIVQEQSVQRFAEQSGTPAG